MTAQGRDETRDVEPAILRRDAKRREVDAEGAVSRRRARLPSALARVVTKDLRRHPAEHDVVGKRPAHDRARGDRGVAPELRCPAG